MKARWLALFVSIVCLALLTAGSAAGRASPASASAPPPPRPTDQSLIDRLQQDSGGQVRVSYHAETGRVRFLSAEAGHPIPRPGALAADAHPVQAARAFLAGYGGLFGLTNPAEELAVMRARDADRGRSFVRFQQTYQGVPVLGGELIVQMDAGRNVVSANGEVLPEIDLDIVPAIDADAARQHALEMVAKHYGVGVGGLEATQPELWIYSPVLLGGPGPRMTALTWRMDVQPVDLQPIKELVLVDARRGSIALHFNQVDTAKNRAIYDNSNNLALGLPGFGPVRTEGGPASGVVDVNNAYDFSGDVYDFYFNTHGRDSLDNAGMQLISTVRYCRPGSPCPYQNAFWNGQQMAYGDGFASADDVVAHELTHGVTTHESNLFYYMQSGAINEAFSDIWGEIIDLANGHGNDAAGVRWQLGEDLPPSVGVIRDMKNPHTHSQPERMGDSAYYNCGELDGGGVHTNSGVANKAAYLLVDGDTFNGKTVTGLGTTKTAKIFYEVQTNLFTSASDYQDLYDGLQQACTNLVGTSGITAADCQEVKDAVDATEMNQQPASCAAPQAPICPAGQAPASLFFDNLENTASGNWSKATLSGSNLWYYPQNTHPYSGFDATYATSGVYNFFGDDPSNARDAVIHMNSSVALPAGTSYLRFNHAYGFQDSSDITLFDGGVVEYSTNAGASWTDAGALFIDNGYDGTLLAGFGNPLGGRQGFGGESNGYISSRLNLTSLAGQSVRFRFRIGSDSGTGDYGWFIDDVRIYRCTSGNSAPVISGLPDQTLDINTSRDNAIDLWAYASDFETPDNQLTFAISNTPTVSAGISLDSNRYIDINPAAGWTGQTGVTIRVTDPGSLFSTDTFSVTVARRTYVYLPTVMKDWPPIVSHTYTPSTDDTNLRTVNADTWYGNFIDYAVGNSTAPGWNFGVARVIMRFNLSSIPAGTNIYTASLQVLLRGYIHKTGQSSDMAITAYRINQAWPATSTWNNFANAHAEGHGSVTVGATFTRYGINVKSLVQGWVNGTWPNYGAMLIGQEGGYVNAKVFYSANASASVQPRLVVDYRDPASGAMLTAVIPAEPVEMPDGPSSVGQPLPAPPNGLVFGIDR